MRSCAEALFQVLVNGNQVEPVIERKQHERNKNVAQEVAEYRKHVGELSLLHPARHGHESNPAEACPDCPVSNHEPRTFLVACKKRTAVRLSRRDESNAEKQQGVGDEDPKDDLFHCCNYLIIRKSIPIQTKRRFIFLFRRSVFVKGRLFFSLRQIAKSPLPHNFRFAENTYLCQRKNGSKGKKNMEYSSSVLEKAVNELSKLPGVGEKTALRFALWLLKRSREEVEQMARSMVELKDRIYHCQRCNNLSDTPVCAICEDKNRNEKLICVVETIKDVMAIENTGYYKGLYHVLGGVISPMEGISVQDIKIEQLLVRVRNERPEEVILALPTTMEGDTTAFYINKLLENENVEISAVSRGISMGDSIEYADEQTLARSFSLRQPFNEIYKH